MIWSTYVYKPNLCLSIPLIIVIPKTFWFLEHAKPFTHQSAELFPLPSPIIDTCAFFSF